MFHTFLAKMRLERSGFTLIELLIALAIISIGLMGLYTIIISTIRGNIFNKNHMTATVMTQDRLERIKNAAYNDIVAANYPNEPYNTIADHDQFQRTVTIEPDLDEPNTKTITVVVSWRNSSGATRNVTLTTIISTL